MIPGVRVAIITCPRDNGYEYLLGTLADMFKRQPGLEPSQVKVFADALEPPTGLPDGVACATSTRSQLDKVKLLKVYGTPNLIRAAEWACEETDFAVTLEDDIIFANDWLERGIAAYRSASFEPEPCVMALSHWLDLTGNFDRAIAGRQSGHVDSAIRWFPKFTGSERGIRIVSNMLWGSQSYLARSQTFTSLCQRMNQALKYPRHLVGDLWLMDNGILSFCLEGHARLWSVHKCLTQHIGTKSVVYEGDGLNTDGLRKYSMYFDAPSDP